MRRSVVFIFLALFSLALSLLCFVVNLASCSGHVPELNKVLWMIPLSLLGGILFLYLFYFLWSARLPGASMNILTSRSIIFKKMLALFLSFLVACSITDGLMRIGKKIGVDFGDSDWRQSYYNSFAMLASILVASIVYRKIVKKFK